MAGNMNSMATADSSVRFEAVALSPSTAICVEMIRDAGSPSTPLQDKTINQ